MASKLSDSLEGKDLFKETVHLKLPLIKGGADSVHVGVNGRFLADQAGCER